MGSKREAYLIDYHRRKTGATFKLFGRDVVELDGVRYPSSYHCLAAQIPRESTGICALDLACGDGRLLSVLAAGGSRDWRLYGVDMSGAELTAAAETVGDVAALIQARAQSLPLPDSSMDWVLSHLALMLMDDVDAVFTEIARVLRPGGTLCAVVQSGKTVIQGKIAPPVVAAMERAQVQDLVPWGDPRIQTSEGLVDLLKSGFSNLVIRDFTFLRRMEPSAYWDFLSDHYSVDCLPPEFQATLRCDVLAAIEPMRESDGMISSATGLRLIRARVV